MRKATGANADRSKIARGQFFTTGTNWLMPQIAAFIASSNRSVAFDPFAGNGDILKLVTDQCGETISSTAGTDIDPSLGWPVNDSLIDIPLVPDSIVVTNPPYLTLHNAKRIGIFEKVQRYFENDSESSTTHPLPRSPRDLYKIAIDRILLRHPFAVALVPETFIGSVAREWFSSGRECGPVASITVITQNPFGDTEEPVCVVCFDTTNLRQMDDCSVFIDDHRVSSLGDLERCRLKPSDGSASAERIAMTFNSKDGWLAVRCIDGVSPTDRIAFGTRDTIRYDWAHGLKPSSRLMTLVDVPGIAPRDRPGIIDRCNATLANLRDASHDLVLSPFKGNAKDGTRRRRLDYATCRTIIERAARTI